MPRTYAQGASAARTPTVGWCTLEKPTASTEPESPTFTAATLALHRW